MSGKRKAVVLALAVAGALGSASVGRAASLNWDPGLTNTATGGGSGTWNLAGTANWFNGASDQTWTDTAGTLDTAVFGGTAGTYTVTLANNLGALGLVFTTANSYTLSSAGSALALGTAGIDSNTLATGTTTISVPINLAGAQSWLTGSGSTLRVTGNITGAGGNTLTKSGGGTLVLTGANTYAGNTQLNGGTTSISSNANIGGASSTINFGGGTLQITGTAINSFGTHTVNYASFNGGLDIQSVNNTFTFNNAILGPGALSKAGAGTLILSGANGHAGGTTLSAGTLLLGNASALGTGTFTVGGTSTLDNTTGSLITLPNNVIALNGNLTYIGSSDLNLGTGAVSGNGSRTLVVKGSNLTIGGPITLGAGRNLTKQGGGTLTLLGANSYDQTTVSGGLLDLGTTGTLGSTTFALNLAGGELRIGGSATRTNQTVSTLSLGIGRDTLTLVPAAGQPLSLTATALGNRTPGGTSVFRGTNLGSAPGADVATVTFATTPTVTTGSAATDHLSAISGAIGTGTTSAAVLRGSLADTSATGAGIGFATYDPTNPGSGVIGVRLLNAATEQDTSGYPGTNTTTNVRLNLAGDLGITGVQTNTLEINNTTGNLATVTNTGVLLDPRNGMLFSGNSATTLTGGTLASTGADAILMSTSTGLTTIDLAVNDAAGGTNHNVLFMGPGNFLVTKTLSASTTGNFWFHGTGTVTLNAAQSPSSGGFIVTGGSLVLGSAFTMASSRPFQIAGGATVDMNGTSVTNVDYLGDFNSVGGTITNTSVTPATLTIAQTSSAGNARTFTGVITGNINLLRAATALVTQTQTLSGQSTYTGTTTISSGTLRMGIVNALPAATPLTISTGGTPAAVLDLNGFNTAVGSLAGDGGSIVNNAANTVAALNVGGSTTTAYSGLIADNGGTGGTVSLVRSGSGTLSLTGSNTYTGPTVVNSGTLTIASTGSVASTSLTANGGTLNVIGSTPAPAVFNATGGTVAFAGNTTAVTATRTIATLNIGAGGLGKISTSAFPFTPQVLQPATLSFSDPTAQFDLTNNELIVPSTTLATVRSLIAGAQIITTTGGLGVGSLDLGGGNVEVRATLLGDTNLDGKVDVTDLGNLASSYGAVSGATWVQGDTNYSNTVDVTDLGNLASNYGGQLAMGPSAGGSAGGDEMIAGSLASVAAGAGAVVPEPTTLGVLAVGAMGLLGRRRRK